MTGQPLQQLLPHILLLMTDQFRYDVVSSNITPNLYHQLQECNGTTTFHRAYTSTPICTPARAALLTGKSPWSHGMLAYGTYTDCSKYPTTLPKILQELQPVGYRTVAIGKNHFGPIKHIQGYQNETLYEGLNTDSDDDYNQWFKEEFPNIDPMATCQLGWNDWAACPYYFDEYMHPTTWTTRAALQTLEEYFPSNKRENDEDDNNINPLFLKVSYHRPHSPYDPPRRIFDQYLEGGLKADVPQLDRFVNDSSWDEIYRSTMNMTDTSNHAAWAGDPGESTARHSRAGYLASVEFVDENIGQIFNSLHEKGLWDDFMIVWVTDH